MNECDGKLFTADYYGVVNVWQDKVLEKNEKNSLVLGEQIRENYAIQSESKCFEIPFC